MLSYKILICCLCLPLIFSCGNVTEKDDTLMQMEFVLVNSITLDPSKAQHISHLALNVFVYASLLKL